jgi:hypothetical protein
MSTIVLDHTQDISGQDTHRLTALFPPPDFVKQASHERLHGDPEGPSHLYADPTHKLYPCHTAAATWMSSLFFLDKQAELEENRREAIGKRLSDAAGYFGIGKVVAQLHEKSAGVVDKSMTKYADDQFAIIWDMPDGTRQRHWLLRNPQEIQKAAEHYVQHRDDFTFDDRMAIANRILDKALEFGAALGKNDDILEKAAGRGACSARDLLNLLNQRAGLIHATDPALSQELTKAARLIADHPDQARGHDNLVMFASIIDGADRMSNLVQKYAEGLPRPEDVLFAVTEKTAVAFVKAHVETTTGNVYAVEDLEKMSVARLRDWMGEDFTDAVTAGGVMIDTEKMATLLPTLDRQMARTFDEAARDMKVPVAAQQKAAAAPQILTRERLLELAQSYQG